MDKCTECNFASPILKSIYRDEELVCFRCADEYDYFCKHKNNFLTRIKNPSIVDLSCPLKESEAENE